MNRDVIFLNEGSNEERLETPESEMQQFRLASVDIDPESERVGEATVAEPLSANENDGEVLSDPSEIALPPQQEAHH